MPCTHCPNGKYKFGSGPCIYDTLAACQRANPEDSDHTEEDKRRRRRQRRTDRTYGITRLAIAIRKLLTKKTK